MENPIIDPDYVPPYSRNTTDMSVGDWVLTLILTAIPPGGLYLPDRLGSKQLPGKAFPEELGHCPVYHHAGDPCADRCADCRVWRGHHGSDAHVNPHSRSDFQTGGFSALWRRTLISTKPAKIVEKSLHNALS